MFVYLVYLFSNLLVIMILSRGLIISITLTMLGCTLLFLYFRNKITIIEKKVNVIFELIQNHQAAVPNMHYMRNERNTEENNNNQNKTTNLSNNNPLNMEKINDDRIEISDDDESAESDDENSYHSDDSMEVSDTDSRVNTLNLNPTSVINLDPDKIKKILIPVNAPVFLSPNKNFIKNNSVDVDSLDEIEIDDQMILPDGPINTIKIDENLAESDNETKSDNEAKSNNDDNFDDDENDNQNENQEFDYSKL